MNDYNILLYWYVCDPVWFGYSIEDEEKEEVQCVADTWGHNIVSILAASSTIPAKAAGTQSWR